MATLHALCKLEMLGSRELVVIPLLKTPLAFVTKHPTLSALLAVCGFAVSDLMPALVASETELLVAVERGMPFLATE